MPDGFPEWLSAFATTGALVFAGAAAWYTRKSAEAAKGQVDAVNKQVRIAERNAERQEERARIAEARAERAEKRERVQSENSEERFLKAQLDTQAPYVYIRVFGGYDASGIIRHNGVVVAGAPRLAALSSAERVFSGDISRSLQEKSVSRNAALRVQEGEDYLFIVTATVEVVNVSNFPARVDVVETGGFDFFGHSSGRVTFVSPLETHRLVIRRSVSSSDIRAVSPSGVGIADFENSTPYIKFWVRDIGMNVHDLHVLSLDLRFFSRDGSRVLAADMPAHDWETIATIAPPRVYERIDVAREEARNRDAEAEGAG